MDGLMSCHLVGYNKLTTNQFVTKLYSFKNYNFEMAHLATKGEH